MSQLEEIKARAEEVSGLCADYMRAGIRHLQRNCDIECPAHEHEDRWVECKEPSRHDGDTIAQVLNETPKLIAALEAVGAVEQQHVAHPDDDWAAGWNAALTSVWSDLYEALQ